MTATMNTATSTVGTTLANAVATRLEAGRILAFSHPEYCGIGLQCKDGVFVLAEVQDGRMPTAEEVRQWRAAGDQVEYQQFATRSAFVAWLAAQSDASLSGRALAKTFLHDNQRLTLARLRAFAA
jgi:hypothetical protein